MSNDKKEKICAVVVTYNRRDLLVDCLNALLIQEYPLDAIYIIDNDSVDRTEELLIEKGFIKELPKSSESLFETKNNVFIDSSSANKSVTFFYIKLKENIGGSGGFYTGLKRSYDAGYDWFWLMDDDVAPKPDCLKKMFEYRHISECIHPRYQYEDGSFYEWEGYIDVMTGIRVSTGDISFKNGKHYCSVNFGCFEGMLISRDIVNKIGYPDKRFFVLADDTVYGFLASLHTNVIYLQEAIIIKKRKKITFESDSYIYYGMRNMFLVIQYLNAYIPRYKIVRYITLIIVFWGLFFYILFRRSNKLKALKHLCKGFIDGLRGKYYKGI